MGMGDECRARAFSCWYNSIFANLRSVALFLKVPVEIEQRD